MSDFLDFLPRNKRHLNISFISLNNEWKYFGHYIYNIELFLFLFLALLSQPMGQFPIKCISFCTGGEFLVTRANYSRNDHVHKISKQRIKVIISEEMKKLEQCNFADTTIALQLCDNIKDRLKRSGERRYLIFDLKKSILIRNFAIL